MEIAIQNQQQKVPVPPALVDLLQQVIQHGLQREAPHLGKWVEVSVVLVDDMGIQALNRDYRGLDRPTDVLSFALLEHGDGEPDWEPPAEPDAPVLLGDIVISLERAAVQAGELGHSLQRELGYLAAHGLLHLLGYDHGTETGEADMHRRAEAILVPLGLGRGTDGGGAGASPS